MSLNVRIEGDVAILSNFGLLMNDPRYVDASRDVLGLLDQGLRRFVLELSGVHETGGSLMGTLMTITRVIRSRRGEAVLAHPSPAVGHYLAEMRMDDYWDVFASVREAEAFFHRRETPRGGD